VQLGAAGRSENIAGIVLKQADYGDSNISWLINVNHLRNIQGVLPMALLSPDSEQLQFTSMHIMFPLFSKVLEFANF